MLPNRGYLPRLAAGSQFRAYCGNYPRFGRYSPQLFRGEGLRINESARQ